MRLLITTGGSRGDVQPYIALGLGLQSTGYAVTIAGHRAYKDMVHASGLGFAPVAGDPGMTAGALAHGGGGGLWRTMQRFRRTVGPLFEQQLKDYLGAANEADAIIYTLLGLGGYEVARELGLPHVGAAVSPAIWPTRRFASCMAPPKHLGARVQQFYNLGSYAWVERLIWWPLRQPYTAALYRVFGRRRFGRQNALRELGRSRKPCVFGWSDWILPRPPDWGSDREVTGYWFLNSEWTYRPPKELARFLETGSPPVCVGFSSLPEENPGHLTRTILSALDRAGERGILLSGAARLGFSDGREGVITLEGAPHDWLFPRCSVVVHHGGAGTTGAALRAGVPNVVIPAYGDQLFWGTRIAGLGAGPAPLDRNRLDAEVLAAAICRSRTDQAIHERATMLGGRIREENGVGKAVDFVRRAIGEPSANPDSTSSQPCRSNTRQAP